MNRVCRLAGISALIMASVCACKPRKTASAQREAAPVASGSVCGNTAFTYKTHIKPVMDAYCVNCHNMQKKAGGIDLSTYELVREEAGKGRFIGSIEHEMPFSPMPKKHAKLSSDTIQMINCWIENGRIQ